MIMIHNESDAREIAKKKSLHSIQNNFSHFDNDIEYEKKYIFKELTEENEILQMFALRYIVYRYVNFIEPNTDQLDIDCYDLYSTFLGAFEVTGPTQRLIGTLRIISGDKESAHADTLKGIYKNLTNYKFIDLLKRPYLFPIMETFNLPAGVLSTFNGNVSSQKKLNNKPYEISRLTILPEYWGSKAKIESGLHELLFLDALNSNPKKNYYIIATHPRTKRKYSSLGFKIIPGTKERIYKPLKQLAIAMNLDLNKYLETPNPFSEKCELLSKTYSSKNFIVKT
ncbi:hypothetical protein ACFL6O_03245 [candidate division KSB1 bacterium]